MCLDGRGIIRLTMQVCTLALISVSCGEEQGPGKAGPYSVNGEVAADPCGIAVGGFQGVWRLLRENGEWFLLFSDSYMQAETPYHFSRSDKLLAGICPIEHDIQINLAFGDDALTAELHIDRTDMCTESTCRVTWAVDGDQF